MDLDTGDHYASSAVMPEDYDVTPEEWLRVTADEPYVFCHTLGTLCALAPRGIRVAGRRLYAKFDSSEPELAAAEVRAALSRRIVELRASHEVLERLGRILRELG